MQEETLLSALIQQAPGMAGIIAVVILFLKAIEKRDQLFYAQMQSVTEELSQIKTILTNHDAASRESYHKRSETLERIEKKFNTPQRKALRGNKQ